MDDQTALGLLIAFHGSVAKAAADLGINETRLANWCHRGISNQGRPAVFEALQRLGGTLSTMSPRWAWPVDHGSRKDSHDRPDSHGDSHGTPTLKRMPIS